MAAQCVSTRCVDVASFNIYFKSTDYANGLPSARKTGEEGGVGVDQRLWRLPVAQADQFDLVTSLDLYTKIKEDGILLFPPPFMILGSRSNVYTSQTRNEKKCGHCAHCTLKLS